jgi:hypothetical protein
VELTSTAWANAVRGVTAIRAATKRITAPEHHRGDLLCIPTLSEIDLASLDACTAICDDLFRG